MVPKWYRQLSTLFLLTVSTTGEKCEKTIQIEPETVEFKNIPGITVTLEDQQKFNLTSILVPTRLSELDDDVESSDLEKCTDNSFVNLNQTNYLTYTISIRFNERIPPSSAFLSSSLTGHVIEVSDDRKKLNIHLCGNREEPISFYEEKLNYNKTTSDKINVLFHMNNDYDFTSNQRNLEVTHISIQFYSVTNPSCSVSGYFKILKENLIETDEGEEFIPSLDLPLDNSEQFVRVYFRKSTTGDFLTHLGNNLGYEKTKKLTEGKIDTNDGIYVLNPWGNKCKSILGKILSGIRLSPSERKFNLLEKDCYRKVNWNHVLRISCSGVLTQTSIIAQSACSTSGNCPIGFTDRNEDEENKENSLCLPNRCTCDNGIPAHSNYASMDYICGLRSKEDSVDEDDVLSESIQGRIFNGQKIQPVDWPFFVKIYQNMPNGQLQNPQCGGAILHPLYVITAAHCVYIETGEHDTILDKVWVHAGRSDFEDDEQDDEESEYSTPNIIESTKIIVRSGYKKDQQIYFNDICLIELNGVLHFSDEIRPICLYTGTTEELFSDDSDPDNVELIVAGYGGTSNFNQADFILQPHTNCIVGDFESDNFDVFRQQDLDTTLCGRGLVVNLENSNEAPNTCGGDSGGPLMVKTLEFISGKILVKWKLVGVVSMGSHDCSSGNSDTLFANVHNQDCADWIEKTIRSNTETGTYCYQDGSSQCVKCDESYKLTNQVCDLEFSQNQMHTVYGFFDTTFCADDCASFMKITPDNSYTRSIQTSIEYKTCTCEHGKPALRCDVEDKDYCDPDSCDEFYHYDPRTKECKRNKCKCDSTDIGIKGIAKNCKIHNSQQCDCKKFYHRDESSGKCVANVCICDERDSEPVPNDKCTWHGANQCIKCPRYKHYDKGSETCVKNICQCPYGKPVQVCSVHNDINCKLDTCKITEEIEYVQVGTSTGSDCVHPCIDTLKLDNHWFSPNEDYTEHWLVVNTTDNGGMDFTEAMEFCKTKGSYVGLPSSFNNLELLTSKIPTPTWLGLKNNNNNFVWERYGKIFNSYNQSDFEPVLGDPGHNCIQVRKDSSDTIIKEFVDCSKKVSTFICEYFVTENEKKSEEKFSYDELSFYYDGFNYAYHKNQKSWADARSICESKGEDWFLAEIKSQNTLNEIIDKIDRSNKFWLGAKKKWISNTEGCGNYSSNPFRWKSDDTPMSNTNDVYKTKLDLDDKPENLCCLTVSPKFRTGKFINQVKNHKNYKNGKVDQTSMDLILKNMYDGARCEIQKEFLCQQKAVEHPFCLDCGNYHQMELLPDEETDGDGHGKKVCIKKNCLCENGIAATGINCPMHNSNTCESCDTFFHLDVDQCEKNICLCENGIAATGDNCLVHNSNTCKSCDTFFHLNVDQCDYNSCNCAAGIPHGDGECFVDGGTECKSCTGDGYMVDAAFQCIPKICHCDNGVARSGGMCTVHDANQCDSCNAGYLFDETGLNCLYDYKCTCDNGIPVDDSSCVDTSVQQCYTCNEFYHREGDNCVENECNCRHGNKISNEKCTVHGDDQCFDCNSGYRLSNKTIGDACVTKCDCPGGVIDSTKCIEDGQTVCISGSCSPFHYEVDTEITVNDETIQSTRCVLSLDEIDARLAASAVSKCLEADCLGITILWDNDETRNDLDLHVYTPYGNHIYYDDKVHDGGVLDHDAQKSDGNPIENVIFEHGAPAGNYRIQVVNFAASDHNNHKDFILALRRPGVSKLEIYAFQIKFNNEPKEVIQITNFDVEGPSVRSVQKNMPELKISRNFILENDEPKKEK